MVTAIVFATVGVVVLALIVIAGTHMVRNPDEGASGTADALGNFIDVFHPEQARADRDLESKERQGEIAPSPDEDDRPVAVDLRRGTVRIRRPREVNPTPSKSQSNTTEGSIHDRDRAD